MPNAARFKGYMTICKDHFQFQLMEKQQQIIILLKGGLNYCYRFYVVTLNVVKLEWGGGVLFIG